MIMTLWLLNHEASDDECLVLEISGSDHHRGGEQLRVEEALIGFFRLKMDGVTEGHHVI